VVVAIESTGVYWKPVLNILEKAGLAVVLVHARHVKNVPGRKTDVKDAEGLATRLRGGLLRSSFVPPQEIRELRDLTRYRTQGVRQRARECERIPKLLENGNIKRARVASNVLGASGRAMPRALSEGLGSPGALANMARGRLRAKIPEREEALRGAMRETQRRLLREQLHKVSELDEGTLRLDAKIAQLCLPFAQALAILDQLPGGASGSRRCWWRRSGWTGAGLSRRRSWRRGRGGVRAIGKARASRRAARRGRGTPGCGRRWWRRRGRRRTPRRPV